MPGIDPPAPDGIPGKPLFSVETLIQYEVTGVFSAEYTCGTTIVIHMTIKQDNTKQPERNFIFPTIPTPPV